MSLVMRRRKIAVVELHGTIGGSIRSPEVERLLTRLREDPTVRAVILDIDSQGGGASASDYIYRSARRLAARKLVIANVRGIGASGGYMIACAAHAIIAAPGAVIGSIGVISVRPALEHLLERAGIGVRVNKSGRFKDLGAPWREATPEENAKLQELVDETYDGFVSIVSERRGLDPERVRELATGEIYLAPRALEVGLVDELGDLDFSLDLAARAADAPRRPVYLRPQRRLRDRLFGPLAEALVESVADHVERRLWQGRHGL